MRGKIHNVFGLTEIMKRNSLEPSIHVGLIRDTAEQLLAIVDRLPREEGLRLGRGAPSAGGGSSLLSATTLDSLRLLVRPAWLSQSSHPPPQPGPLGARERAEKYVPQPNWPCRRPLPGACGDVL